MTGTGWSAGYCGAQFLEFEICFQDRRASSGPPRSGQGGVAFPRRLLLARDPSVGSGESHQPSAPSPDNRDHHPRSVARCLCWWAPLGLRNALPVQTNGAAPAPPMAGLRGPRLPHHRILVLRRRHRPPRVVPAQPAPTEHRRGRRRGRKSISDGCRYCGGRGGHISS